MHLRQLFTFFLIFILCSALPRLWETRRRTFTRSLTALTNPSNNDDFLLFPRQDSDSRDKDEGNLSDKDKEEMITSLVPDPDGPVTGKQKSKDDDKSDSDDDDDDKDDDKGSGGKPYDDSIKRVPHQTSPWPSIRICNDTLKNSDLEEKLAKPHYNIHCWNWIIPPHECFVATKLFPPREKDSEVGISIRAHLLTICDLYMGADDCGKKSTSKSKITAKGHDIPPQVLDKSDGTASIQCQMYGDEARWESDRHESYDDDKDKSKDDDDDDGSSDKKTSNAKDSDGDKDDDEEEDTKKASKASSNEDPNLPDDSEDSDD